MPGPLGHPGRADRLHLTCFKPIVGINELPQGCFRANCTLAPCLSPNPYAAILATTLRGGTMLTSSLHTSPAVPDPIYLDFRATTLLHLTLMQPPLRRKFIDATLAHP